MLRSRGPVGISFMKTSNLTLASKQASKQFCSSWQLVSFSKSCLALRPVTLRPVSLRIHRFYLRTRANLSISKGMPATSKKPKPNDLKEQSRQQVKAQIAKGKASCKNLKKKAPGQLTRRFKRHVRPPNRLNIAHHMPKARSKTKTSTKPSVPQILTPLAAQAAQQHDKQ